MRINVRRVVRKGGSIALALIASFTVPFLIWTAVVLSVRQIYREWLAVRAGLMAGNLACRLDNDCPPGYVCVSGKCLPQNNAWPAGDAA